MELYRCRKEDLQRLSHLPANSGGACCLGDYYLTAEVRYLGSLRKAAEMKLLEELEEKRRQELLEKREEALRSLGMEKREFDSETNKTLMIFLLGDFLRQRHPNVRLTELKARYAAISRVREVLHKCCGAHPGAAFDFCVQNPDAGPAEFQELKDKMRKVFRMEGERIFRYLTRSERLGLRRTPLREDVFHSDVGRNGIRRCLVARVGRERAEEILDHPDSQRRICRGGEESKVATKLLEFWNERCDPEERRQRLKAAFAERGRSMQSSMPQCQQYIAGTVDYDPEELILLDTVQWKSHRRRGYSLFSDRVRALEHRVTRVFCTEWAGYHRFSL